MISTPNPNIESQFEEDKMVEWVKQLKDLQLDATIMAIDELIRSRRQGQIDSLIKQPLVELRQMTYDMLKAIRAEESIKIEEKPFKRATPEYIDKLLKENGFK